MPKKAKAKAKRKPRKHAQTGKGAKEVLSALGNFVRDHKLISKGLGLVPHPAGQVASQIASMAGLGRAHPKHHQMAGRGIFSDLGGGIGSAFGGLGSGIGSIAHGFFG